MAIYDISIHLSGNKVRGAAKLSFASTTSPASFGGLQCSIARRDTQSSQHVLDLPQGLFPLSGGWYSTTTKGNTQMIFLWGLTHKIQFRFQTKILCTACTRHKYAYTLFVLDLDDMFMFMHNFCSSFVPLTPGVRAALLRNFLPLVLCGSVTT